MNTHAIRSTLIGCLGAALALASGSVWATMYRLTDLGPVLVPVFSGVDINASGQVAGSLFTGAHRAFRWDGTTVQTFPTLRRDSSFALALNASGQVTGYATTAFDTVANAFLWDGNTSRKLGTLGGTQSFGLDINDAGQVTGSSLVAGNAASHAFLWDGTTMRDLGTLGGCCSGGTAINDSGQVTGSSVTASGETHAFLWDGTTMQDLGTLGGNFSEAVAINASGQVIGDSRTGDGTLTPHAFLWDGTTILDLGPGSFAKDLNDSGQVTGFACSFNECHAFLWDGTSLQDLGTLGGIQSIGFAVNELGQVTGAAFTEFSEHAFLWDGTSMLDLNAFIQPSDPLQPYVELVIGRALNDRGQIVAEGIDRRTFDYHVYLLTPLPVPESGTLALLGLGLAGLGFTRRRKAA